MVDGFKLILQTIKLKYGATLTFQRSYLTCGWKGAVRRSSLGCLLSWQCRNSSRMLLIYVHVLERRGHTDLGQATWRKKSGHWMLVSYIYLQLIRTVFKKKFVKKNSQLDMQYSLTLFSARWEKPTVNWIFRIREVQTCRLKCFCFCFCNLSFASQQFCESVTLKRQI